MHVTYESHTVSWIARGRAKITLFCVAMPEATVRKVNGTGKTGGIGRVKQTIERRDGLVTL